MLTAFLIFVATAFTAAAVHTVRDARRYTPAVQLGRWILAGAYGCGALMFIGFAVTGWRP